MNKAESLLEGPDDRPFRVHIIVHVHGTVDLGLLCRNEKDECIRPPGSTTHIHKTPQ